VGTAFSLLNNMTVLSRCVIASHATTALGAFQSVCVNVCVSAQKPPENYGSKINLLDRNMCYMVNSR